MSKSYKAAFSITIHIDSKTLNRDAGHVVEVLDDMFWCNGYTVMDSFVAEHIYCGLLTDENLQASHSKDCCDKAVTKLERICLDEGLIVLDAITYGADWNPNFIYDGISIEELCPTHAVFKLNASNTALEPVYA